MTIVEIASESEAAAVYARLQALGEAWRPAEDVPCLVYLEDGSADEVSRIPGVASCWEGRSGRIARLLHKASEHFRRGRALGAADPLGAARGRRAAGERLHA